MQYIINLNNVSDYFRKKQIFSSSKIDSITELTSGNSMLVHRVFFKDNRKIIIRQALDRARAKKEFKMAPERINWELKAISLYQELVSDKKILPKVLFHDPINYIVIMKDSLKNGVYFQNEFLKDYLHENLVNDFARFFTEIHGKSYGKTERDVWMSKEMHKFWTHDAFLRHYLVGLIRLYGPKKAEGILEKSRKVKHSYCWMDPVWKNIIVGKDWFRVYDFEQATVWDPAYDIGAFLAPWIFKYIQGKINLQFVKTFYSRYRLGLKANYITESEINEIAKRSKIYLHTTLLHVTIGNNQWDFISDTEKDIAIKRVKEFFSPSDNLYKKLIYSL